MAAWAASPPQRFDVVAWRADLLPPQFPPHDSLRERPWAPDTLAGPERPHLVATFAATPPVIDGDLGDWRFVRWNDLTGASSFVRGKWTGSADLRLKFAMLWTPEGIVLGARLYDDVPTAPGRFRKVERVTLALASPDSGVQRYWRGGSRRVRIGTDAAVEAWTDVRNRRPERFDAMALGTRAASRRVTSNAGATETETVLELFVPWMVFFPVLPARDGRYLANILVEDDDGGAEKLAVWSVRPEGQALRQAWAELDFVPGSTPPGWIVAASTPHPETWMEWMAADWRPPSARAARNVELRTGGAAMPGATLRSALPVGSLFRLRVGALPRGASPWPAARRGRFELRLPGESQARAWDVTLPLELAGLRAAADSLLQAAGQAAAPAAEFPSPPDIVVRLDRARRDVESMGNWPERRYHATGLVVWRAATWDRIDTQLEEAQVLRDAAAQGRGSVAARLDALWPRRTAAGGLPIGVPLLRGYLSAVDGSTQPYLVCLPESSAARPPLLVALHDVDQDETTLLESTSLAARAAAHGWVVLCPAGRGSRGYVGPAERDVLDALAAVRAAMPVDDRRLYLTGLGMGGTGTWLLTLRHPDLFAAASIVSGYGDFDQPGLFEALGYKPAEREWYDAQNPLRLLRRDMTTAYRIAHGEKDAVISPVHARIAHARLEELGVSHEYRLDPQGDHGLRFFDDDLAASFEFMSKHARTSPGTAAGGMATPGAASTSASTPIAAIFGRGPFAIVWGAGDERSVAEQLAADWEASYHGAARVVADDAVTPEMMRTMDLVLVGDRTTNALLERWAGRLPVRYDPDAVIVRDTAYPTAKFGVVFAAANPEFPGRSVVAVTAMHDRLGYLPRSLYAIGTPYAIVSSSQGLVELGSFDRP